jgi:methionyl-tRNA formyltransferase
LHDKLARLGAQLLADSLAALEEGALESRQQDETRACYAGKLEKSEALIDWSAPAVEIMRRIRAFNAWPVAETRYSGRQLRIWDARVIPGDADALPGMVLSANKTGIEVACGEGRLRLLELQLPGARAVTAREFINAHAMEGVHLGGK